MQKFGLIGYPLSHSYSPKIHELIYKLNNINASYSLNEIGPEEFGQNPLIDIHEEYQGLNVTIPYKTGIIQYLNEIDDEAKQIGAVNTIKKIDNKWIGYNTDAEGFCYPIMDYYKNINTAQIIGTGGAAKAAIYATLKYVKPHKMIILGRNVYKAEELKNIYNNVSDSIIIETNDIINVNAYLSKADLIVNATSVGMHPNINDSILPESFSIKAQSIVYDLIYNPQETRFLKRAKEICPNCTTINGYQMLIAQAVKSIELWTGKEISIKNTITALNKSRILL